MDQAVQVAGLLFWALLPIVVFGTKKWAVLAWFLMGNLDASGREFAAASSVGLINAVKGIGIPLFLAWRLRKVEGTLLHSLVARLWIALILYASLAACWSPFPLSAAKLLGSLVGILFTVIVFEKAGKLQLLNVNFLMLSIIVSLGLAVVQTYVLGGKEYGFDGEGIAVRFTSFISTQQYAALLVALLAALFSVTLLREIQKLLLVLPVFLGILLTGSRVWTTGALVVIGFRWLLSLQKKVALISYHFLLALAILAIAIWGSYFYAYISLNLPRLAQFIDALTGHSTVASIGTYNNRLEIYNALWQDLSTSNIVQIIFGHGTSSAGYIFAKDFLNGYVALKVDLNRIAHDEFLRSLYEWGILGLLIFVSFLIIFYIWLMKTYIKTQKEIYIGVISYLVSLCLYIKTENLFAGAGSGVTMGFAMLLGIMCQEEESQPPTSRGKYF